MTTLGNKHECSSCGAKFYDLGKSKIVCPSCGTDQAEAEEDEASAGKAPAARKRKKAAATKKQPKVAEASEDTPAEADQKADEALGNEEEDEDLLEDD